MFSAQLKHGVYGKGIQKTQLDWSGWAEKLEVCVLDHRKHRRPLSRKVTSGVFERLG